MYRCEKIGIDHLRIPYQRNVLTENSFLLRFKYIEDKGGGYADDIDLHSWNKKYL